MTMTEPAVLLAAAAAAAADTTSGMTSILTTCIDKEQDEEKLNGGGRDVKTTTISTPSTTATTTQTTLSSSSALLSKMEKRRLKKLQKKAHLHNVDASLSGILLQQDWKDLLRLNQKLAQTSENNVQSSSSLAAFGPRIQWRVSKRINHTGTMTKGTHHRDLLYKLLNQHQQQQQQEKKQSVMKNEGNNNHKKRPRIDDDDTKSDEEKDDKNDTTDADADADATATSDWPWPEWATIHNPVAVEHIAVLQVHVNTRHELQQLTQLIENEASATTTSSNTSNSSSNSNNSPGVAVLSTPTEWFKKSKNSNDVKSISDILLYSKPKDKKMSKKQKRDNNMTVQNTADLVSAMQDLILTRSELQEEHYPLAMDHDDNDDEKDDKKMEGVNHAKQVLLEPRASEEQPEVVVSPPEAAAAAIEKRRTAPSDWSLVEAKAAIQPYEVIRKRKKNKNNSDNVTKNNDDSTSSSRSFPPWIMTEKNHSNKNNMDASSSSSSSPPRIWALDCEMVETKAGRELARITLVQVKSYSNIHNDVKHKSNLETCVVLDTLVRPKHVVTNYLTQYSGVSASDFVTTDENDNNKLVELEQVHAFLLHVISHNDIIVGHSLENDFYACRWIHTTCVDTAVLFRRLRNGKNNNSKRFMKHSLRHLAQHLLHKQIQRGNSQHSAVGAGAGHCSVEDAMTALELAVRRAVEGPTFGSTIGVGILNQEMNQWPSFCQVGKTVAVGPGSWLNHHVVSVPSAVHALNCEGVHDPNRKAVTSWLTTSNNSSSTNGVSIINNNNGKTTDRRAKLVWSHWDLSSSPSSATAAKKKNDSDNSNLITSFMELVVKDLLQKVQASNDTLVFIPIQCGYTQVVEQQGQRRIKQDSRTMSNWTHSDEERLVAMVEECRVGAAIWIGMGKTQEP